MVSWSPGRVRTVGAMQAAGRLALVLVAAGTMSLPALAPAAAAAETTAWSAHAFPSMPQGGCLKAAWADAKIYAVRTPRCNLEPDQSVTFEAYDPATGVTRTIATLPSTAAQATVKEVAGQLYIFTPQVAQRAAVAVHAFDPSTGALQTLSSTFPGSSVDAPTFVRDGRITFTSSCVWSCSFVTYAPATDSWTVHEARLPDDDPVLAKLGLLWDGELAHILTLDHRTGQWRFFDYDPATDTLAPGAAQPLSASGGPFLQTGPTSGIMAVTAAPGFVHIMQYDLTRASWKSELGTLASSAAPRLWGGVGWAFHFPSGGVSCIVPGTTCDATGTGRAPTAVDENGNGFADSNAETQADVPPMDTDMDSRPDDMDNCPALQNPSQHDLDSDGLGDVCDADADGDGITLAAGDNCPMRANADQADADGNAVGDVCEPGAPAPPPAPKELDADGDGVLDEADNCAVRSNPTQADLDGDLIGDPCDVDVDGDGIVQVANAPSVFLDNCPLIANTDQVDTNLDGLGDACDAGLVVPAPKPDPSDPTDSGYVPVRSDKPDLGVAAATAAAGAAAVGAGVALWSLRGKWLPLFGLFSRQVLVQNDMQPSRRALLAAVEAHPGIHFNELARLTQQGRGAVQHHLKILEARGSIRMVRYGRYTCVYPAQAPPTPADGVLKSEVARRLDGMVRLTPGMTAAEASRMLGVTYGAAAYHMRRMAEAGLVRLEENPLAAYPIPHGGYNGQAAASSGGGPGQGGGAGHLDHMD